MKDKDLQGDGPLNSFCITVLHIIADKGLHMVVDVGMWKLSSLFALIKSKHFKKLLLVCAYCKINLFFLTVCLFLVPKGLFTKILHHFKKCLFAFN